MRLQTGYPPSRRRGFTLVEMLVSTALIIFIMVILTQAFVTGMDTLRGLKTIGDLQEKLRTATTVLRKDLSADHFEGKKKLSDPFFWIDGPPQEGFFRLYQGSPVGAGNNVLEGRDSDIDQNTLLGIPSYRYTDCILHFTVKRRGNRPDEFASAAINDPNSLLLKKDLVANAPFPPGSRFQTGLTYKSQWYEVAYFLRPTGDNANGTPRYTLYRRQRLAVVDNVALNWTSQIPAAQLTNYSEVSCNVNGNNLYFNSPTDLTVPDRRFGMSVPPLGTSLGGLNAPIVDLNNNPVTGTGIYPIFGDTSPVGQNPALQGADILVTDVISFEVKVLTATGTDFVDVYGLGNSNNPAFKATGPMVFDTWSSVKDSFSDYSTWATPNAGASIPLFQDATGKPLIIKALKITIRVWDLKTQTSRQITMVQDM
jgi:type II secretory pathway pseudopilin PulG